MEPLIVILCVLVPAVTSYKLGSLLGYDRGYQTGTLAVIEYVKKKYGKLYYQMDTPADPVVVPPREQRIQSAVLAQSRRNQFKVVKDETQR